MTAKSGREGTGESRLRASLRRVAARALELLRAGRSGNHQAVSTTSPRLRLADVGAIARTARVLYTSPARVVDLVVEGGELLVPCDALRIEQVFAALLAGVIRRSPGARRIEVRLVGEAKAVRVMIAASGDESGESVEMPAHVLSLRVARRIVEAQGGRVQLEPPAGLTFWLPRAPSYGR